MSKFLTLTFLLLQHLLSQTYKKKRTVSENIRCVSNEHFSECVNTNSKFSNKLSRRTRRYPIEKRDATEMQRDAFSVE